MAEPLTRLAIRMPKMSMTMTEGEVGPWFAKVGDEIAVGDVVCEVMTDKVDMEVESSVAGTLVEILFESGMVAVGEPMAWVEGEDDGGGFGDLLTPPKTDTEEESGDGQPVEAPPEEEVPAEELPEPEAGTDAEPRSEPEAAAQPAPEPEPEPEQAAASAGPLAAVPRARGLAREHGVDLASLTGSGNDGLILVSDVEAAVRPAAAAATPRTQSPDRRVAVRQAVARKMTASAAIPQFTVWRTLSLEAADAGRQGLSWTTVLLRAYAASLREVPELLSRWEDDRPTEPGPPSVALAIATDRGLLVPTFVDPDLGPATTRDAEIRDVVAAARGGKVDKAYMAFANSSLSNLGGLGVDRFQALLTPPQASVLSLGTITLRPAAVPGGVISRLSVEAGLTVDHRVADGAHGAQLLAAMARHLEADAAKPLT